MSAATILALAIAANLAAAVWNVAEAVRQRLRLREMHFEHLTVMEDSRYQIARSRALQDMVSTGLSQREIAQSLVDGWGSDGDD